MIRILLGLLLALIACGGEAPFTEAPFEEPEQEEELGTLAQPLTWDNGYGNRGSGSACTAPWSGTCYLPGKLSWKIRWDCTGCTTRMLQAITNTKLTFANRMAALGITITWVTSNYDVYIEKLPCTSGSPTCLGEGSPSILDDAYWMPNAFSVAQEYHFYTIRLNYDGVNIAGLTNDQQRYAYGNLGLHELGHFIGLSHTTPGNCMENTSQPGAFAICTYNTTQNNWISNWDPNTND